MNEETEEVRPRPRFIFILALSLLHTNGDFIMVGAVGSVALLVDWSTGRRHTQHGQCRAMDAGEGRTLSVNTYVPARIGRDAAPALQLFHEYLNTSRRRSL